MIDPKLLCNKHLIGEHGEIHKHKHIFEKKYSINGRIHPVVQIEPNSMKRRHDELVEEMTKRGMKHKSDYEQPDLSYLKDIDIKVNIEKSLSDLIERCSECKKRIENGK